LFSVFIFLRSWLSYLSSLTPNIFALALFIELKLEILSLSVLVLRSSYLETDLHYLSSSSLTPKFLN
jgi:hypothetical protein